MLVAVDHKSGLSKFFRFASHSFIVVQMVLKRFDGGIAFLLKNSVCFAELVLLCFCGPHLFAEFFDAHEESDKPRLKSVFLGDSFEGFLFCLFLKGAPACLEACCATL